MRRPLAVVSDDETFPNAWLTEENEMVEMAALVLFCLHNELRNIYSVSSSFPYLILLENGPKAVDIEEENVVESILDRRRGAEGEKPSEWK